MGQTQHSRGHAKILEVPSITDVGQGQTVTEKLT